jgi:hypothetical protein
MCSAKSLHAAEMAFDESGLAFDVCEQRGVISQAPCPELNPNLKLPLAVFP